jgi:putative transposase
METFRSDADFRSYIGHMRWSCARHGVDVWAYCLMPNHSHLALVPESEEALRRAVGEAHQFFTSEFNERAGCTGRLWQGRFLSFVMDERHTLAAARYIEHNPVRAGLVARPEDYPWSSARAHLAGVDDQLVRVAPLLERVPDWAAFLRTNPDPQFVADMRRRYTTGRPLGDEAFIDQLEIQLGRRLRPLPIGHPPVLETFVRGGVPI